MGTALRIGGRGVWLGGRRCYVGTVTLIGLRGALVRWVEEFCMLPDICGIC
jgi:hypothetical protein